jgi:hypothetical protein
MFQKKLYNGIPNVTVWRVTKTFTLKGVQTIHRPTQTLSFGIPLKSSF